MRLQPFQLAVFAIALAACARPASRSDVAAPTPPTPSTGAEIFGTVTERGTGRPISFAEVVVSATDGPAPRRATTTSSGSYRIEGLDEGAHLVKLTYAGIQYSRPLIIPRDGQVKLDIAVAGSAMEATESAQAGKIVRSVRGAVGAIDGSVVDKKSGAPIEGAVVAAKRVPDGKWQLTMTHASGHYHLMGLPVGTYLVSLSFQDIGYALVEHRQAGVLVESGDVTTVDFSVRL